MRPSLQPALMVALLLLFAKRQGGFEDAPFSGSGDDTLFETPRKDAEAELEKLMEDGNKNFAALVSAAKQRANQQGT